SPQICKTPNALPGRSLHSRGGAILHRVLEIVSQVSLHLPARSARSGDLSYRAPLRMSPSPFAQDRTRYFHPTSLPTPARTTNRSPVWTSPRNPRGAASDLRPGKRSLGTQRSCDLAMACAVPSTAFTFFGFAVFISDQLA